MGFNFKKRKDRCINMKNINKYKVIAFLFSFFWLGNALAAPYLVIRPNGSMEMKDNKDVGRLYYDDLEPFIQRMYEGEKVEINRGSLGFLNTSLLRILDPNYLILKGEKKLINSVFTSLSYILQDLLPFIANNNNDVLVLWNSEDNYVAISFLFEALKNKEFMKLWLEDCKYLTKFRYAYLGFNDANPRDQKMEEAFKKVLLNFFQGYLPKLQNSPRGTEDPIEDLLTEEDRRIIDGTHPSEVRTKDALLAQADLAEWNAHLEARITFLREALNEGEALNQRVRAGAGIPPVTPTIALPSLFGTPRERGTQAPREGMMGRFLSFFSASSGR
jgi:hypothetical protein